MTQVTQVTQGERGDPYHEGKKPTNQTGNWVWCTNICNSTIRGGEEEEEREEALCRSCAYCAQKERYALTERGMKDIKHDEINGNAQCMGYKSNSW